MPSLRALVEGAGLRLHRFLGHAEYTPSLCGLAADGVADGLVDPWQAAAAAELFHGTLIKHRLVLTHPARAFAWELVAQAGPERLVPRLHPDVRAQADGAGAQLCNPTLQVPSRVTVGRAMREVLGRADGTRTVQELGAGWPGGGAGLATALRRLYLADVVLFEVVGEAGADPV